MRHRRTSTAIGEFALGAAGLCMMAAMMIPLHAYADSNGNPGQTATPIQHLVVIFQENVSFDHYFATYPIALNPSGEPRFKASADTPTVNGLGTLVAGQPDGVLLTHNPNANNPANGSNAINPFRLDRSQASTCGSKCRRPIYQQAELPCSPDRAGVAPPERRCWLRWSA